MTQSTSKTEDTSKNQSCSGGCFKWGCLFPILSILVLVLFAKIVFGVLSFCLDVPAHTLASCAKHGIDMRTVVPIKKKTVMLPGMVPLELVWVPAGTFTTNALGTRLYNASVPATCTITISQGFWMGQYEFTRKQWRAVLQEKCKRRYANYPVRDVSWNEVQEFISTLNEVAGENFRLPTSAEWEYAYRAGTTTPFYWGDEEDYDHIYLKKDFEYTWDYPSNQHRVVERVGRYLPNTWGLYDMAGNVSEWCQDGFYELMELDCPAIDPIGPGMSTKRMLRSGYYSANSVSSELPTESAYYYGFRVLLPEKNLH